MTYPLFKNIYLKFKRKMRRKFLQLVFRLCSEGRPKRLSLKIQAKSSEIWFNEGDIIINKRKKILKYLRGTTHTRIDRSIYKHVVYVLPIKKWKKCSFSISSYTIFPETWVCFSFLLWFFKGFKYVTDDGSLRRWLHMMDDGGPL